MAWRGIIITGVSAGGKTTIAQSLTAHDSSFEQVKAVIAGRYGITRGEAFELLRHMSQTSNRKLRDVAHAVLEDVTKRPA